MSAPAVDWELAARVAPRLVRPGPAAAWTDRMQVVDSLRTAARTALPHAARVTGLEPPEDPQTLVVDRGGWARANVQALATVTGATPKAPRRPPLGRGAATGLELAGALALLSGSVLGQVDPWGSVRPRLLLVAPNVLATERSMEVPAEDFRLWVALHEQTHVLQFGAAPWLAGHLADRVRALWEHQPRLTPATVRRVVGAGTWSPLELLDPEQRAEVDRIGAVMSVLEGHADVAMDAVGTRVIPSVRQLRRRFTRRRSAAARATGIRRVVRTLLGVDVKMAQYADGARFVRGVRRRVGWDGFNAAWSAPELLPSPQEVADPAAWVRRVHG
ncbi:zinc-dependent metalloprotease [Cellulomonas sp. NPDC089187]|uniref:zinc-dependent metalloprotease n=1 Tax=Cellulomonas sp. NPDC089187 TaxID=3154970 RepID=UPI0034153C28